MAWQGRGSTREWRKIRATVLERDPICRCGGCRHCTQLGCTRPSQHADHILNVRRGGTDDPTNLAGLCPPCHDVKTQHEAALGRSKTTKRTVRIPGLL